MSDDSVIIGGSGTSSELRLSEREGLGLTPVWRAYYRATLQVTDMAGTYMKVVASTKVLTHGPDGELTRFFDAMAADRGGWEGEKRWESVGGVLKLRGKLWTYEVAGRGEETRVGVEAELKFMECWWVKAEFNLGPGELEGLAAQVRQFFAAMADT